MVKDELWKSIKEYSKYAVSNRGRVCSLYNSNSYGEPIILKPMMGGSGYFHVTLYTNKSAKRTVTIHRLVLEAFVSTVPDGCCANHKDGVKTHNDVSNLEWVTYSEDVKHAFKKGLRTHTGWLHGVGENTSHHKLKDGEVWLIKKLLWFEWPQKGIAKMFKVHQATVSCINLGKTWSHIEFEPTERDREAYKNKYLF